MANPSKIPLLDRTKAGLAWRQAGDPDNPAVLFLHGLGGSRTSWDAQLEDLATDYFCIAWDLPGYGASESLSELTFPAIADQIVRLLDVLEIKQPDIVGLSFGGQQALHLALNHASRVRRLVLADTSAEFGADGTDVEEWKQLRLAALDAGKTPADLAETIVDSITGAAFAGVERDRAIASFKRIPSSGLRAAVHCLPTNDARSRLGQIETKTLVLLGELDEETPLAYSELLREEIPNAELVVLPGIGHLSNSEGPAAFNTAVRAFLAD